MPSTAGVTSGATTSTSAPAASSAGRRRWATVPPPTTTTRRPASVSPTRYGRSPPVTRAPARRNEVLDEPGLRGPATRSRARAAPPRTSPTRGAGGPWRAAHSPEAGHGAVRSRIVPGSRGRTASEHNRTRAARAPARAHASHRGRAPCAARAAAAAEAPASDRRRRARGDPPESRRRRRHAPGRRPGGCAGTTRARPGHEPLGLAAAPPPGRRGPGPAGSPRSGGTRARHPLPAPRTARSR